MTLTKKQIAQLNGWSKLEHCQNITIKNFLGSQPKIWWYIQIFLITSWLVLEVVGYSSNFIRIANVMGITFNFILFIRTKLYWPLMQQCLDWDKINQLLKNQSK